MENGPNSLIGDSVCANAFNSNAFSLTPLSTWNTILEIDEKIKLPFTFIEIRLLCCNSRYISLLSIKDVLNSGTFIMQEVPFFPVATNKSVSLNPKSVLTALQNSYKSI